MEPVNQPAVNCNELAGSESENKVEDGLDVEQTDSGDSENNINDGNDGEDESDEKMQAKVSIGSWNINGLGDYKQHNLIGTAHELKLDVLALCETHLVNSEQLVQWERCIKSTGQYQWHGRAARPTGSDGHGRGSGGVGIMVRSDWSDHITSMPECDHECLHFVRLDLPDSPFPMFFGTAYLVPVGSPFFDDNMDC